MIKRLRAAVVALLIFPFGFIPSERAGTVPAGLRGQITHEVRVTNIEVPVRAFKGTAFIDTLKKEDFEVFEDGVLQQIDAVYLIRKTNVARKEGGEVPTPRTARLYVLLFEMIDYHPEIAKAMDYFFANVFEAGDDLILMTPMKTYNLKKDMLRHTSPGKIKNDLLAKVRKDILMGGTEYRGLLRDIPRMVSESGNDLDEKLILYDMTVRRLENMHYIDQKKLLHFAELLKSREGQKHVFFFYQRELLPKINPKQIAALTQANQDRPDMIFDMMGKFEVYHRDVTFDVKSVREAFCDSSISVNFLFLTKTGRPSIETPVFEKNAAPIGQNDNNMPVASGGADSFLTFEDQSEDIYSAFSEIAKATGGLTESSASAEKSFQRAAAASENYYLLYYRPTNIKSAKAFRKIEIRVKGGGLRLTFRQGYISD